jgi:hypothetical protein
VAFLFPVTTHPPGVKWISVCPWTAAKSGRIPELAPDRQIANGLRFVQAAHNKLQQTTGMFRALSACLLLGLFVEPVLANKFETISGGVSGSLNIKREWLQAFFLVTGGISLLAAILAVVVPHRNALFLNYANWKQSAIILLVAASAMFAIAAVV